MIETLCSLVPWVAFDRRHFWSRPCVHQFVLETSLLVDRNGTEIELLVSPSNEWIYWAWQLMPWDLLGCFVSACPTKWPAPYEAPCGQAPLWRLIPVGWLGLSEASTMCTVFYYSSSPQPTCQWTQMGVIELVCACVRPPAHQTRWKASERRILQLKLLSVASSTLFLCSCFFSNPISLLHSVDNGW